MAGAPELRALRYTGCVVRIRIDFWRGKPFESEQLQESGGGGRRITLRWIAGKQVMVMEGRLNRATVLAAF